MTDQFESPEMHEAFCRWQKFRAAWKEALERSKVTGDKAIPESVMKLQEDYGAALKQWNEASERRLRNLKGEDDGERG